MEKETPLISFIITTYNLPAALIEECVNSVMAIPLTAGEREVIVIDDGSDPPALEVLSDHRDDMIYVRQPNGGLSSARNRSLDMARGTYIQFVDGDDHLWPEQYGQCVDIVRREQPDILTFLLSDDE